MNRDVWHHLGWAAMAMALGLVVAACVATTPAGLPSQGGSLLMPNANLTALAVTVDRLRGDVRHGLVQDESVDVQPGDRIAVLEQGRGLLRFPDRLVVELFRDTQIDMADVRLEAAGFIFVRMRQAFGHTRAELTGQANARLILTTDYATITAIEDGTEFVTCHAPELTCMVTLAGATEVRAQGEVVTVRAGEATYIFPDQPPQPPTCADLSQVRRWMDAKRGSAPIDPLGALVISWGPDLPCGEEAPPAPVAETTAVSTPTETALPLPAAEGMVSIPPGEYVVGAPRADDYHVAAMRVSLPAFWLDQFEVTHEQYAAYLAATGHTPPLAWPDGTVPPGRDRHPVQGVTWEEAARYCAWALKRLPTEAEWEVAARGPGEAPALYPWGADPLAGGQVNALSPVESYPVGSVTFNRSPFDVYDQAGNVWEWVDSPYAPVLTGHRLLRGGRYGLQRDMAYRQQVAPDDDRFRSVAGFRCAADRVEGE